MNFKIGQIIENIDFIDISVFQKIDPPHSLVFYGYMYYSTTSVSPYGGIRFIKNTQIYPCTIFRIKDINAKILIVEPLQIPDNIKIELSNKLPKDLSFHSFLQISEKYFQPSMAGNILYGK